MHTQQSDGDRPDDPCQAHCGQWETGSRTFEYDRGVPQFTTGAATTPIGVCGMFARYLHGRRGGAGGHHRATAYRASNLTASRGPSPGQPQATATAHAPVFASLSPPKPGLNRDFQAELSRPITMSRSHPVCSHALMQIREVLAASHTREQLLTRIYRIVLVGSHALSRGYLTEPPYPRTVIRQRQSTYGTTPRGKRTRWGNLQHVDELRASKTPAVDPCGAYPYPSPLLL
ncbi:hypothetical protein BD779DRAFT_1787433 [Infundibulicybe gibba]|nr:hypothetical protein BD779DRAFT_1787433 [Infundibulicybe gibba]